MKKIKFVRYGGLSPVNHKKIYKEDHFHSPPKKKGIYAFIFPYIEHFLWVWKTDDHKKYSKRNRREFEYTGEIWTHFVNEATIIGCILEIKKDWVKIHTDDLGKCLDLVKKSDRRQLNKDDGLVELPRKINDPYKGLMSMSKDHLEVFIERV